MVFSEMDRGPEFDYLSVDTFMKDIISGRALLTAFQAGLIDVLCADRKIARNSLVQFPGMDRSGMSFLIDILIQSGVFLERGEDVELTESFRAALRYRDLMLLKLDISGFAAHDLLDHFTDMISGPVEAMGKMGFTRLFSCVGADGSPESNREQARKWMRITTGFTRYEAHVCMKYHDFSPYRKMLDVGGNSGEFALQACRKHPQLKAAILDLPIVCEVGREYVAGENAAERLDFIPGDALHEKLPPQFDLVTFKSILHDWPEALARRLIEKGSKALKPGGTLLIFERGPLEPIAGAVPYSLIPFLLFFASFRSPRPYEEQLRQLDFREISVRRIDLEMPFHLLTATKAG